MIKFDFWNSQDQKTAADVQAGEVPTGIFPELKLSYCNELVGAARGLSWGSAAAKYIHN